MKSRLAMACLFGSAAVAPAMAGHPRPSSAAAGGDAPETAAVASAPTGTDAATPLAPTPPRLSNFADTVFAGIVGENAPELSTDFAEGATIGTMPLLFEKTTLDQLQQSYGGLIHSQGDAGEAVSWLCYTQHAAKKRDVPETVWFTSTSEMADSANTLSMVVEQRVDAAKKSGCATAPRSFAFPSFGVPGLGTNLADLRTRFGPLKRDRQGNLYFNSTRPRDDGSGRSIYQTLGYVIGHKKGVVSAIALSQVTTD